MDTAPRQGRWIGAAHGDEGRDDVIEIATSPTTTTVTIAGDLDLAERSQFPEIAARIGGLRRQLLVIDMCRTTFMDSTGAAFLISLADGSRRRGGATVLRGCDDRDLFVLEICGALELFRFDTGHHCPPEEDGAAQTPVADWSTPSNDVPTEALSRVLLPGTPAAGPPGRPPGRGPS